MKKLLLAGGVFLSVLAYSQVSDVDFGVSAKGGVDDATMATITNSINSLASNKVDIVDGVATNLNLTASFYLLYIDSDNYVQWTYDTNANQVVIYEVNDGSTNTYYDLTD